MVRKERNSLTHAQRRENTTKSKNVFVLTLNYQSSGG